MHRILTPRALQGFSIHGWPRHTANRNASILRRQGTVYSQLHSMKSLQVGMTNMLYHSSEYSTYKVVFIFLVTTVSFHSLQLQNIVPTSTNAAISILYSMAAAT